ncbi:MULTISPECIES: formate/nitrite transporter family protein [Kordiimonas]|jgi:formate/nitrite transporter|uniref:formate/nitrite transporter family protein n=1 Tax=Kordiimonas TaxID=288021 RepID=UPI00257D5746|nr:formate/nitrite transporter family protein [Kordiimonas sp. UBA4487]
MGYNLDAYSPAEIAKRVEDVGVAKVGMPAGKTLVLAILAGAFISLGAVFYTLAMTGSPLGFGPARVLGGLVFSTGLILVIVAGAELFTGNNLIVMAWADRRVTLWALLRNWGIVYIGNLIGALGTAVLVVLSGIYDMAGGAVGETAASIAASKLALPSDQAFFRGVLCNVLVCLAVWLCFAAHSVTDKILAIVLPISAFVALGFEHSVANMYVIPVAMLDGTIGWDGAGLIINLVWVTAGNIVGGGGLVALVYWLVYGRAT